MDKSSALEQLFLDIRKVLATSAKSGLAPLPLKPVNPMAPTIGDMWVVYGKVLLDRITKDDFLYSVLADCLGRVVDWTGQSPNLFRDRFGLDDGMVEQQLRVMRERWIAEAEEFCAQNAIKPKARRVTRALPS